MFTIQRIFGKLLILILIFLTVWVYKPCFAQGKEDQDGPATPAVTSDEKAAPGSGANDSPEKNEEDGITHKDVLRYSILIGAYPVTFLVGVKSWRWMEGGNHEFKSEKEGWFGQDTSLGGADKGGHFFAHYMIQRLAYSIFDYTEDGHSRKWIYSLGTTLAVGTMIEVGDGWSSRYGFSYEDLIIDTCGLLFGAALDYFPTLDAFLGLSIEYYPTKGYREHRDYDIPYDWIDDYSGLKYLLNIKLAGFEAVGFDAPDFLRYVQIDIGYYTQGYSDAYDIDRSDYDNPSRNVFIGISVNLAEVVSDLFEDRKSLSARIARKPFEYYHIPVGYKCKKKL